MDGGWAKVGGSCPCFGGECTRLRFLFLAVAQGMDRLQVGEGNLEGVGLPPLSPKRVWRGNTAGPHRFQPFNVGALGSCSPIQPKASGLDSANSCDANTHIKAPYSRRSQLTSDLTRPNPSHLQQLHWKPPLPSQPPSHPSLTPSRTPTSTTPTKLPTRHHHPPCFSYSSSSRAISSPVPNSTGIITRHTTLLIGRSSWWRRIRRDQFSRMVLVMGRRIAVR